MAKSLQGKRIAMLVTDGVERIEYEKPRALLRAFLEEREASVELISPRSAARRSKVSTI